MTKTGKLSKREMETLSRAWGILSKWSEIAENSAGDDEELGYVYEVAMNAVCGLCEFIGNYECQS